MKILANQPLKHFNTFGIKVSAKYFVRITDLDDLKMIVESQEYHENKILILGGGSNLVFLRDFNGLILHLVSKGIEIVDEDESYTYVKSQAGEAWHDLVLFCLNKNLGGVENLSLIPGTVGAAPIQNIGAYGCELKDVFFKLEAFDLKNKRVVSFNKEDCDFGYRDSVFKKSPYPRYVILNVTFALNKKHHPNASYGQIQSFLDKAGITQPSIQDLSRAVIHIRQHKLPDPQVIGNSGSFFKNPIVELNILNEIKKQFPDVPHYIVSSDKVKVPAAWLIDKCGWKGKSFGSAGVYKKQALVLVNLGDATGSDIMTLTENIQSSVKDKFQIELTPEVHLVS